MHNLCCLYIDRNTPYSSCDDGAVRLLNGTTSLEGRLEICINNAWGTVCQNAFSSDEASIVCSKLGLDNGLFRTLCFAVSVISIIRISRGKSGRT